MAALALALLAGSGFDTGTAKAAAEDLTGTYSAHWAGLPSAEIRLRLARSGDGYREAIRIESLGIPRWFTHFRASVEAGGTVGTNGRVVPGWYRAAYDLRKRHDRRISMRFVQTATAPVAERQPDDTSRKPPLSEKFRRNVLDPLAALAAIRARLQAVVPEAGQHFTVPVYDGARRFDVAVAVVSVGGKGPEDLIRLRLDLIPIAGFKGESSDDGDPDNAARPVDLAFTHDANLWPVSLRVSMEFLPFTVHFEGFCPGIDACPTKE